MGKLRIEKCKILIGEIAPHKHSFVNFPSQDYVKHTLLLGISHPTYYFALNRLAVRLLFRSSLRYQILLNRIQLCQNLDYHCFKHDAATGDYPSVIDMTTRER